MSERVLAPARVTVVPTDLFAVFCHALESGEFRQLRGVFEDDGAGRCAWGVMRTIAYRAGGDYLRDVHPRMTVIERRAGRMLGYDGIASANDAGERFVVLAAALRAARIAVERENAAS